MIVCFETEMAGFAIKLEQFARGDFRVTYGARVERFRDYSQAAHALGLAIMHAAACEGRLTDNEYA